MRTYYFFRRLHRARMWLTYRLVKRHRYHLVDTGLAPGYYDCDILMLHACMALLKRYVVDECGGLERLERWTNDLAQPGSEGHGPRDAVDGQAAGQNEAATIYRWWTIEYPRDQERRDALVHMLYSRDRMKFVPSADHPGLHQILFEEFKGDEAALYNEMRRLERKIEDDEQAMLHRLIEIRGGLWT